MAEPTLDQIYKNHIKVARTAIRLKHSIQADNELAEALPALRLRLESELQMGRMPALSVGELIALVEGEQ